MSDIFKKYKSLYEALKKYRKHYGAFSAIFLSPYFHIAVLVCSFFVFLPSETHWWEFAIDLLPTMIGFTLAGYAIMLSFAADRIGPLIASEDFEDESAYIRASTTFFHFIFVQIICLLNAFITLQLNSSSAFSDFVYQLQSFDHLAYRLSAWIFVAFKVIGSLAFFYAIALSLATLVAVYRLTGILDHALTAQLQQQMAAESHDNESPEGKA